MEEIATSSVINFQYVDFLQLFHDTLESFAGMEWMDYLLVIYI